MVHLLRANKALEPERILEFLITSRLAYYEELEAQL